MRAGERIPTRIMPELGMVINQATIELIGGIKEGKKWNFEVYLIRLSFIKVTTSVTHASIYRLGSFLEKIS